MIKIEHTEIYGWEAAIRGCRNPMNSWDKSDSGLYYGRMSKKHIEVTVDEEYGYSYQIGPNDAELMKNLVKAGTDHSKFMRYITVTCDITAPLYWWKEYDTYKVGTVANSCSTMHKISDKEFTLDDFSCEHLLDGVVGTDELYNPYKHFCNTVSCLNKCRLAYLETKDKKYWWQMIQLLPSSYNQKRTVLLNYQVLRNMYHSRKNHKLDEWHDFCSWVESLPYSELITEK